MYDLNYTFLTELEVDTRQSFDDLSDDLLLLDYNSEESKVVDMKSTISSWQNYFWKSPNQNKQRLDITFTDISIYRKEDDPTKDWLGNPLNDLEMMSVQELENFLNGIDQASGWAGGRTWEELSNTLCSAITALQAKYVDSNNIYPPKSVLVTNENPNNRGFGTWEEKNNCYLSEIFSSANYGITAGLNGGTISGCELKPSASSVPNHTHKISYLPATGNGGGGGEGSATPASTPLEWFNTRRGLDPTPIGRTVVTGHGNITTVNGVRTKYSGKPTSRTNKWYYTSTVMRDANSTIEAGGDAGAKFSVLKTKVDPVDNSIKVAPKTYPLSASIWERKES